jgi:aminomethyltransferase
MPGRRSPLHSWHEKHGAKFSDEHGWEVPIQFQGIQQEYAALRNGCAMIDLCHLSRIRLNGDDRVKVADELLTIDVAGMAPRTTRFGFVCNDRGGVIDGVLVYKDDKYILLTGHPKNKTRLLTWLRERAGALAAEHNLSIEIDDVGTAQGQMELRGPSSKAVLEAATAQPFLIENNEAQIVTIGNARCLVTRRQFAGVDGFIIVAGAVYIQAIWDHLALSGRALNVRPVGEAALEVLRIEAAFPSSTRELDEDVTPIEASSQNFVDLRKLSYTGRRAILHGTAAEFARRLVLLRTGSDKTPEPGSEICFDALPIGHVTSSTLSFAMRSGIALGYVDAIKAAPGTRLTCRNGAETLGVEVIQSTTPTVT